MKTTEGFITSAGFALLMGRRADCCSHNRTHAKAAA
jgi:hypothetical protein